MAFKYSCFVSYCHGQHELTKSFIDQLSTALKNYLERYLDEEVYVDHDRLKPGYEYNEALAQAICESVCMVVVYSPRYERHEYCLREFTAMKRIEEKRRALLGPQGHGRGFIIPIVFGGDVSDLPPRIKASKHFCDFSRFTLASTDISRNPDFIKDIEGICQTIYELYRAFQSKRDELDKTFDCTGFAIPAPEELCSWRSVSAPIASPFPGRAA